jgi:hypothetical protein
VLLPSPKRLVSALHRRLSPNNHSLHPPPFLYIQERGFSVSSPDTHMTALSVGYQQPNETICPCCASLFCTNDSGTFDREKITFVDFYVSVYLTQCLSRAW